MYVMWIRKVLLFIQIKSHITQDFSKENLLFSINVNAILNKCNIAPFEIAVEFGHPKIHGLINLTRSVKKTSTFFKNVVSWTADYTVLVKMQRYVMHHQLWAFNVMWKSNIYVIVDISPL